MIFDIDSVTETTCRVGPGSCVVKEVDILCGSNKLNKPNQTQLNPVTFKKAKQNQHAKQSTLPLPDVGPIHNDDTCKSPVSQQVNGGLQ